MLQRGKGEGDTALLTHFSFLEVGDCRTVLDPSCAVDCVRRGKECFNEGGLSCAAMADENDVSQVLGPVDGRRFSGGPGRCLVCHDVPFRSQRCETIGAEAAD